MSDLMVILSALVVGGLVGLAGGVFLYWLLAGRNRSTDVEAQMRDAFEALARQSLRDNAHMFLDRTRSELEPLGKSLDKLEDHLRELEQKREGAYQGLRVQLDQLAHTHSQLQETTVNLSQALRASTVRGRWGELQLRRVVELAGLVEHVDFEEQATGRDGRPDMIVHLPNGGVLPVDAKVPMKAYLDAVAAEEETTRDARMTDHTRAMRGRVRDLARKQYWTQFDPAPQFVVMFVPSEACLSAAFRQDGDLLDDALQSQVVIASPVTLLALLKAVGYGWQQVHVTENARRIAEEGRALYERLGTLTGHIDDVGDHLRRSVEAYNRMIGSLELRLLPSARRFQELGVGADDPPGLQAVDETPRRIAAEELRSD